MPRQLIEMNQYSPVGTDNLNYFTVDSMRNLVEFNGTTPVFGPIVGEADFLQEVCYALREGESGEEVLRPRCVNEFKAEFLNLNDDESIIQKAMAIIASPGVLVDAPRVHRVESLRFVHRDDDETLGVCPERFILKVLDKMNRDHHPKGRTVTGFQARLWSQSDRTFHKGMISGIPDQTWDELDLGDVDIVTTQFSSATRFWTKLQVWDLEFASYHALGPWVFDPKSPWAKLVIDGTKNLVSDWRRIASKLTYNSTPAIGYGMPCPDSQSGNVDRHLAKLAHGMVKHPRVSSEDVGVPVWVGYTHALHPSDLHTGIVYLNDARRGRSRTARILRAPIMSEHTGARSMKVLFRWSRPELSKFFMCGAICATQRTWEMLLGDADGDQVYMIFTGEQADVNPVDRNRILSGIAVDGNGVRLSRSVTSTVEGFVDSTENIGSIYTNMISAVRLARLGNINIANYPGKVPGVVGDSMDNVYGLIAVYQAAISSQKKMVTIRPADVARGLAGWIRKIWASKGVKIQRDPSYQFSQGVKSTTNLVEIEELVNEILESPLGHKGMLPLLGNKLLSVVRGWSYNTMKDETLSNRLGAHHNGEVDSYVHPHDRMSSECLLYLYDLLVEGINSPEPREKCDRKVALAGLDKLRLFDMSSGDIRRLYERWVPRTGSEDEIRGWVTLCDLASEIVRNSEDPVSAWIDIVVGDDCDEDSRPRTRWSLGYAIFGSLPKDARELIVELATENAQSLLKVKVPFADSFEVGPSKSDYNESVNNEATSENLDVSFDDLI